MPLNDFMTTEDGGRTPSGVLRSEIRVGPPSLKLRWSRECGMGNEGRLGEFRVLRLELFLDFGL